VPPPEPTYGGKPEHAWLYDLQQWNGDTNDPAFQAFRAMGTNALPELLTVAQLHRSSLDKFIDKVNRRQSLVNLPARETWLQNVGAAWALYAMGSNALPALPNMLFTDGWITAATALAGMGPEGIPSLLQGLTNRDYRIRSAATLGLGFERARTGQFVPALVARLVDSNQFVRYDAIVALGELHLFPEVVVPVLVTNYSSNDAATRCAVITSLGEFETNAITTISIVRTALNDTDPLVRQDAARVLLLIDPNTKKKRQGSGL
jgi:HEAT repeat protein